MFFRNRTVSVESCENVLQKQDVLCRKLGECSLERGQFV